MLEIFFASSIFYFLVYVSLSYFKSNTILIKRKHFCRC